MKASKTILIGLACALAWPIAELRQDDLVVAQSRDDRTTTGEFIVDPPTLINLGFEWFIEGDDNRNAVGGRRLPQARGLPQWTAGLPLLRLHGERISGSDADGRDRRRTCSPAAFSTSSRTQRMKPGSTLTDPDGVPGDDARKTVTVRTRPEPMPSAGGRVFHVYPPGFTGAKIEPAFEGLMCAYNYTCARHRLGDGRPAAREGRATPSWSTPALQIQPLRVHEQPVGQPHRAARWHLLPDRGRHGGHADRHQGRGRRRRDLRRQRQLRAVRCARPPTTPTSKGSPSGTPTSRFWAGTQFIAGRRADREALPIRKVGSGIFTNYSGSSNFYIADNYFIGRDDPDHVIGWSGEFWAQFNGVDGQKFPPAMASYVAVKLYGPGHVVAYNYVANFHDGINVETYGNPDGSAADRRPQLSAEGVLGPAAGGDRLL